MVWIRHEDACLKDEQSCLLYKTYIIALFVCFFFFLTFCLLGFIFGFLFVCLLLFVFVIKVYILKNTRLYKMWVLDKTSNVPNNRFLRKSAFWKTGHRQSLHSPSLVVYKILLFKRRKFHFMISFFLFKRLFNWSAMIYVVVEGNNFQPPLGKTHKTVHYCKILGRMNMTKEISKQ